MGELFKTALINENKHSDLRVVFEKRKKHGSNIHPQKYGSNTPPQTFSKAVGREVT